VVVVVVKVMFAHSYS